MSKNIYCYIGTEIVNEDNFKEFLDSFEEKCLNLGELRKIESLCSILSKSSRKKDDVNYYKKKESEVLIEELKNEEEENSIFRLINVYEDLANLFKKDNKKCNEYLEESIKLLNKLDINEEDKDRWLNEINKKRSELFPNDIQLMEYKIKYIDEELKNGDNLEGLLREKSLICKNLVELYEKNADITINNILKIKEEEIKTLIELYDITKNYYHKRSLIYALSVSADLANKYGDSEKNKYFLEMEYEYIKSVEKDCLNENKKKEMDLCLFYTSGKLGKVYYSEKNYEKSLKYKKDEIKIGFKMIDSFKDCMNNFEKYEIKKRLLKCCGYTSKLLKRMAESSNNDDVRKNFLIAAKQIKETENYLLEEDDMIKMKMDKNKRYSNLMENYSTIAKCHKRMGDEDLDLYYLEKAYEFSEKIDENYLVNNNILLNSVEFITRILNEKCPGKEYEIKNLKYRNLNQNE